MSRWGIIVFDCDILARWGIIVAPAMNYSKHTIEVKKGTHVDQMKRVRIFKPLHVLVDKVSVSDVEGLKILKLSERLVFNFEVTRYFFTKKEKMNQTSGQLVQKLRTRYSRDILNSFL